MLPAASPAGEGAVAMKHRHPICALFFAPNLFAGAASEDVGGLTGVRRSLFAQAAGHGVAEGAEHAAHGVAAVGEKAAHGVTEGAEGAAHHVAAAGVEGAHGAHTGAGGEGGHALAEGHGGGHGEEHEAIAKVDVILLFGGGIIFFSLLYYMTSDRFCNKCVPGTTAYTWKWISLVLSLFLASILWMNYDFTVNQAVAEDVNADGTHETQVTIIRVVLALIYTAVLLAIYIAVVSMLHCCGAGWIGVIEAFLSVWAHTVGFAQLHVVSDWQNLVAEKLDAPVWLSAGVVWLVCIAALLAAFFIINTILMRCCVTPYFSEDDEDSPKKLHGQLREFAAESNALALAWTFLRIIIAMSASELPKFMTTDIKPKTTAQKWTMFAVAVVSTLITAGTHGVLQFHKCKGQSFLRALRKFVMSFTNFLAAFAWLEVIRYFVYGALASGAAGVSNMSSESLFLHIFMAFFVTYIGLALVPILACCSCASEGIGDITFVLAILAAFSWYICLDIVLIKSTKDGMVGVEAYENPFFYTDVFLLCLLFPMYVFAIYPTAKSLSLKDIRRLEEDSFEQEEEEYDDLPEDDEEEYGISG